MKENLLIIIVLIALFLLTNLIRVKFKSNTRYTLITSIIGIVVFLGLFVIRTIKEGALNDSLVYYLLLIAVIGYFGIKGYKSFKELKAKWKAVFWHNWILCPSHLLNRFITLALHIIWTWWSIFNNSVQEKLMQPLTKYLQVYVYIFRCFVSLLVESWRWQIFFGAQ